MQNCRMRKGWTFRNDGSGAELQCRKINLVGKGRFELPTPRTPSECSTRLSHVPTWKDSTDAAVALRQTACPQRRGSLADFTPAEAQPSKKLLQISPVRTDAHLYLERHAQGMHLLHVLAHQRLHHFNFVFGDFEDQFVEMGR